MTQWPFIIDDEENIVRAIFSPFHIKNGKIKSQAFHPSPKTDEVSVMRADWIGANACKKKAKEMENRSKAPHKIYTALAVLSARQIRQEGIDIIDSRNHFDGHADIKLGIQTPEGEPPSPEQVLKLNKLKENLAKKARLLIDGHPESKTWGGPALVANNYEHEVVETEL